MASLEWTDDLGFVSLSNGYEAPVGRFQGWEPLGDPVGPLKHALGTGTAYMWKFRDDFGAKFSLRELPDDSQALLARLRRHLKSAGEITVVTGDLIGNTYVCTIYPGSDVSLGYDAKYRKRSVTVSLLNSEQADMVCLYP